MTPVLQLDAANSTAALNGYKLTPKQIDWKGRDLALFDRSGKVCEVEVGELAIHSEFETEARDIGDPTTTAIEVAQKVFDEREGVLAATLIGDLKGTCKGAVYARDKALPPPTVYSLSKPDKAVQKAIDLFTSQDEDIRLSHDWEWGPTQASYAVTHGTQPPTFAIVSVDSDPVCGDVDEQIFYILRLTKVGGVLTAELVFYYADDGRFKVRAAVDLTGNKTPEFIGPSGVVIYDAELEEFGYLRLTNFESGLIEEGDECE